MKTPKVSIVTVNYKQPVVTSQLLDSIARLSYPNIETIVVDNAQPNDDSMLYKVHLPDVKVVNLKENMGFAHGNNAGIQNATGDYILLLNNDTEVADGMIEKLLEVLESSEQIGAVSPIIRYFDHPDKIQFAGFTEVSRYTGRNELINKLPKEKLVDSAYFHGAAVMLPMKVIKQCGLMPEDFFLYYEELDWSRIIKKHNYQIKVTSEAEILHKESITTGKNSPLKVYYQNRNRIHFMRRSFRGSYFIFLLYFLAFALPKNFLTHLLKREFKHLKAFIKAFNDGLIIRKTGFQPI